MKVINNSLAIHVKQVIKASCNSGLLGHNAYTSDRSFIVHRCYTDTEMTLIIVFFQTIGYKDNRSTLNQRQNEKSYSLDYIGLKFEDSMKLIGISQVFEATQILESTPELKTVQVIDVTHVIVYVEHTVYTVTYTAKDIKTAYIIQAMLIIRNVEFIKATQALEIKNLSGR